MVQFYGTYIHINIIAIFYDIWYNFIDVWFYQTWEKLCVDSPALVIHYTILDWSKKNTWFYKAELQNFLDPVLAKPES